MDMYSVIMSGQADTLASHRRPPLLTGPGAIPKSKRVVSVPVDKGPRSSRPKLCRQRSSSQPKLPVDGALRRGSLDAFLLDGRARSNSLAKLTELKRNLSASNLAALSDSNLSVQEAEPLRSYDKPHTSGSLAKRYLEQLIKRYYYQLSEGCGEDDCKNRFCKTCRDGVKLTPDIAAIISIQLALSQRLYFCSLEKFVGRALPENVFQSKSGRVKSFLQTLYSCSPFATLFKDAPPESLPRTTGDSIAKHAPRRNSDHTLRGKIDGSVLTRIHNGEIDRSVAPRLQRAGLDDLDGARDRTLGDHFSARKLLCKPPSGKLQSSSATSLSQSTRNKVAWHGHDDNSARVQSTSSNPSLDCRQFRSNPALCRQNFHGSHDSIPNTGSLPSNSGLLRCRRLSLNAEGALHNSNLSSSHGHLSLRDSFDNLARLNNRSRTSSSDSISNQLLRNSLRSRGSGQSLTSGAAPSPSQNLRAASSHAPSNQMHSSSPFASPIQSPTASPRFSPAQSPTFSTISSSSPQELCSPSPREFNSPSPRDIHNSSPQNVQPDPSYSPAPSPAFSPPASPTYSPSPNYYNAPSPAFSPAPSSTFSSAFSPAPSPMRLLSDKEALEETDDVREFERSLSLELSMEFGREFSLTHLTLDMLQSIIDQYNECGDDAFLLNTIRTVFVSDAALNASFKVDEGNPRSSVALPSVRAAYNLLWTVHPRDKFVTALANALEILLMKLDQTFIQPHEINQILIILECPLLETNFELAQVMCRILAKRLVPSARSTLVQGLSQYQKERFQRLLEALKSHLATMIRPKHGASEAMIHVAVAIGILYDANRVTCHKGPIRALASVSDFYCQQLSRDVDYQTEYRRWQHRASLLHQPLRDDCSNDLPIQSLLDFPFLLDPASKVHVLHFDAVMQMRKEYQMAILHQARVNQAQKYLKDARRFTANLKDSVKAAMCPFLVLEIRREYLISDTLSQIRQKKNDLKKPLKIKYIGGGEQGLDMGGLQKEFFQLISEAVFNPSYGMFVSSEENRTIWINGSATSSDSTDEFELVGTLLGLAIYNGIILDVSFPMVLYKKLHGQPVYLEDLAGVMPSLARGLREMLEYESDDVEDVFCQTFQVSYTSMGEVLTVDLVPNGSSIPVTNKNREEYAKLYVQYLLNYNIAKQFEAFARGFHSVCGGSAIQLFQPSEIELLICGNPELDFKALETSATYEDGFSRKHQTILGFWRTVHTLSNEQKKKLLHFITGSDRVPLQGLSSLPIVIQRNGPDSERLPTAMTCFNRLLLPEYKEEAKLKDRLLLAIQYGKGFGLT